MPKVPKIKVSCRFYISKIDETEGCSETFIRHFSGGLDHL
jgi:hypothetical protein